MGVLTMGTAIPDTVHVATDGLVIGIKTPRYEGFGARAVYVYAGGLQGNVPQGPLNPARPWDSYAAGKFLEASYHVPMASPWASMGATSTTPMPRALPAPSPKPAPAAAYSA